MTRFLLSQSVSIYLCFVGILHQKFATLIFSLIISSSIMSLKASGQYVGDPQDCLSLVVGLLIPFMVASTLFSVNMLHFGLYAWLYSFQNSICSMPLLIPFIHTSSLYRTVQVFFLKSAGVTIWSYITIHQAFYLTPAAIPIFQVVGIGN